MPNLQKLSQLVAEIYEKSPHDFGRWMWQNHVPIVAEQTTKLAAKYNAEPEIAVAGAWLHDLGDAFVDRHASDHEEISRLEAEKVMQAAGYSPSDIQRVFTEVIEVHSCRDGNVPTTTEGKVMATADALAHLTTDFYVQFTWLHLPENKTYDEFLTWVAAKLERDFHDKIFFDEVREQVRPRYEALREVFVK